MSDKNSETKGSKDYQRKLKKIAKRENETKQLKEVISMRWTNGS